MYQHQSHYRVKIEKGQINFILLGIRTQLREMGELKIEINTIAHFPNFRMGKPL